MASFTRLESMRPFSARLAIRASFVAPELRHAILMVRVCWAIGPRMVRRRGVRSGNVATGRGIARSLGGAWVELWCGGPRRCLRVVVRRGLMVEMFDRGEV